MSFKNMNYIFNNLNNLLTWSTPIGMGMGVRSTLYHVRICDFAEYRTDYYVNEEIAGTLRHRATSIHKLLFENIYCCMKF